MGALPEHQTAGFVLTGGKSTRMGRDKALLPLDMNRTRSESLVEHVATRVRAAAGRVSLIGAPERYAALGLPLHADLVEDCGPIGGVYTALKLASADWNLVVACDMPGVTVEFLTSLLKAARDNEAVCVAAQTPDGLHPLCAVYHRRALPAVEAAIARKSLKMQDLLSSLRALPWPVPDPSWVENINTRAEWEARGTR